MTNLYNRRRFFSTDEGEFSETLQERRLISVTLLDLDYFKQVNDIHWHLVCDQMLIHITHLIRDYCRDKDMAARYAGEEFAVLHLDTDRQAAYQVVEEIRKVVESTPYMTEKDEIGDTFSAGVVDTQVCRDCPRIDNILSITDKALYCAKDAGRNQVVIFAG